MGEKLYLGLDVGSTTIKLVCIRKDGEIIYTRYQRHNSDVRETLVALLDEAQEELHDLTLVPVATGSAGMALAQSLGMPFVQEVIACTTSIQKIIPTTDVAIELGGEDAKITFFDNSIEQRMNETCAGGTGAFIDQMASFLQTDAAGLNDLAKKHNNIYPIASRCGVFAKTDIMPLLNEGACREDIAASIFQAVVDQTVGGLACGRAIEGNIAFLGGPLYFLSELRKRFIESLELTPAQVLFPDNAHYFVALGAALEIATPPAGLATVPSEIKEFTLKELAQETRSLSKGLGASSALLPPLFSHEKEEKSFKDRHESQRTPRADLSQFKGELFLGFDVGSTTIKSALIDEKGTLYHSSYQNSDGKPLNTVVGILKEIYEKIPAGARIAHAGATGYGGGLIKAALGTDLDEVETVAHYRAAQHLHPEVSFILDIGGQDMKCLHVENGVIDRVMLNEACSAGCGVFVETFAKSLGMSNETFTKEALKASEPVDLGSRCTVFMNSKVKQAQKEGYTVGDIAAGLAYSVVRNALYKVIKTPSPEALGKHVVAQGGSFLNDALLRAFELLSGLKIFRPDISGLMGAYGVALIACEEYAHKTMRISEPIPSGAYQPSTIISKEDLAAFDWKSQTMRCGKCGNRCLLTLSRFSNGTRYISGNRCERGALGSEKKKNKTKIPNLYNYKNSRLFDYYEPLSMEEAYRGQIGIPRALNMFENYPFWFSFFTELGYRVELSSPTNKETYNLGISTIPSQTACYPAKLAHGHVIELIHRGVKDIFFPSIPHEAYEYPEADCNYNCPVVSGYPELLRLNLDALEENNVTLHIPFLPFDCDRTLAKRLHEEMKTFPGNKGLKRSDIRDAIEKGNQEMEKFRKDMRNEGAKVLKQVLEGEGPEFALILAGHPYHIDPGINHGIANMIASMGVAILTEDSVAHLASPPDPLRVVNQWTYHARLYRAAAVAGVFPKVGLVQLTSFGCGLDAVTSDQVQEILENSNRIFTLLKIDEGANLGAARIRIRSLLAAERSRAHVRAMNDSDRNYPPTKGSGGTKDNKDSSYKSGLPILSQLPNINLPTLPDDPGSYLANLSEKVATALLPRPTEATLACASFGKYASRGFAPEKVLPMARTSIGIGGGISIEEPERAIFTEKMRDTHTILVPQMAPIHFGMIESALQTEGYKAKLLPKVDSEAVELGLKYINNDVCFPALMAVGQLIQAVQSGKYDTNKIALLISQTGGGCRATNYIAFLRKAMADTGFSHIPLLSFNISGLEQHPGFEISTSFLKKVVRGGIYGDVLSRLFYRTRPYEIDKGQAKKTLDAQLKVCNQVIDDESQRTFKRTLSGMVEAFSAIPIEEDSRPKVGVVGEIYLKYNPQANNNIMDIIEEEGGEAVPGDLIHFLLYCLYDDIFKADKLAGSKLDALKNRFIIWWIESMRNVARKALAKNPRYGEIKHLKALTEYASSIIELGHQTGEGWLLTAEMVELVRNGVPNIACLQPFACLPNHITGKGVIKELRKQYPLANVAAIDYDSGASQVNQLNRIKLMMAVAHRNHNDK